MPRRPSIADRATAAVRPPSHEDRRGDRPIRSPQFDQTYGKRRRLAGQHEISKVRNGARLKDLVRLVQAHRRENLSNFIRQRGNYLIAAACHCPRSVDLADWLPNWAALHLNVPRCPDLDAKLAVAIACEPPRLSAEEAARLLRVTFDRRQRLKLWTLGACDLSPKERKARVSADKKRKDRESAAERRRKRGAKSHAQSLSRAKPWTAEGISRRTWERRRKKAGGN
jgi:hypothetical protein